MNPIFDHQRLLYRISRDYYINQMTQQEIAKRLGLSRIKVSRLLEQARREMIVSITLNAPLGLMADVEETLEKKFGLQEVLIVHCENSAQAAGLEVELAPAAAECLLRRITGEETISVAMGRTMVAVVNALPPRSLPGVSIVQMNGGLGYIVPFEQSTELARQMAARLAASHHLLHAPGIAADKQAADLFKKDPLISSTLNIAAHADIAILSIGSMVPQEKIAQGHSPLTENDYNDLVSLHAVGDIALRYINADGHPLHTSLDERIIGLSFAELMAIPCVIAVAGGEEKHQVILAGLKSGIPNVLVTDQNTAEFLLNAGGE
ncbi:MAG: sugar-binding transcriptional regulator [Calditrichaeota bacterium]|nr:MAG: sugar-binding transcriptional regulator [Calditrichota bacterium]